MMKCSPFSADLCIALDTAFHPAKEFYNFQQTARSRMSFINDDAGSPAPPALPVRNVSVSSFGSGATTESFQGVGRHGSTSSSNGVGRFSSVSNAIGSRKMTSTVRASNKAAILAVGEELRQLLHAENPPLIKDRRYHLRSYQACFAGHEMVDWLLKKGEVESRREAVAMMQKLIDHGVLHHGEQRADV